MSLIRQFNLVLRLRKWPTHLRKKKQNEFYDIIQGLSKWVQRGLEKPEQQYFIYTKHNLLIQLYGKDSTYDKIQIGRANFTNLLKQMIVNLPFDNRSGSVMSCLKDLFVSKSRDLNDRIELDQVERMLGQMHIEVNIIEKIRVWVLSRIELHVAFESIQQEKKNMISMATKAALHLVSGFTLSGKHHDLINFLFSQNMVQITNYDAATALQYSFVHDFYSIPTILKYISPFIQQSNQQESNSFYLPKAMNFKNIFSSYYFSKQVDMNEEEKEEQKKDAQGNLINELQKDERKMFIFANTFELLHTKLVNEMNTMEVYPILKVLETSAQHLGKLHFVIYWKIEFLFKKLCNKIQENL